MSRRGVLFTLDQAKLFVGPTGKHRMWDYHWAPSQMVPDAIVKGVQMLGVDTSNWGA